jgi:MFS family permease
MTAVGFPFGVALSTAVGRRPVLLASAFINTIATAVVGFFTGFGMFFISVGGQGLTAGMILAMVCLHGGPYLQDQTEFFNRHGPALTYAQIQALLVVIDATFISERPWAAAALWCAVSIMMHVYYLPISFFTGGGVNWRPVYQFWVVPCIISFFVILIWVPETFFLRPSVAFNGRLLVQSASEHTEIYDTTDAISPSATEEASPEPDTFLGRLVERLSIHRAPGTNWRAAASICVQMVLCLGNPLVIWASLLGGVVLAVAVFQNETQFKYIVFNLFTTEPLTLQLRRADVYFAASGIISAVLSIPLSAPLITWFVRFCARRSGGTRHAEVYLIGYLIPITTAAITIGLYASSRSNHWPIGTQYVIYAITNISYVLVISAGIVWLAEAFPLWVAAAVAVQLFSVILIGSLLGAKLASWASTGNIIGPSIVQGTLVLVMGAIIVPIAFWGKSVRQYIHGRWSLSQKGALRPQ